MESSPTLTSGARATAARGSLTKTEAAFHLLRAGIEDGHFRPGERLSLPRLLEELDMSPTPIREALRLLQAEGLVEHQPHRGMVVASYSPESAEEIYRLRVVLEPLATQLAVERATPVRIARIRALHGELSASVGQTQAAALNAEWHRTIYGGSESRHLQEFISRLWTAIPVRAIWLTGRAAESCRQHAAITEAIERRDADAAADLMREHVLYGAVTTTEHLRRLGAGA
jgi:DNA-binding GntR family transcriptional regulator